MRKLIPFLLFAVITLNVPDREVAIVETYVIDAEQWLLDAWKAKVAKSRERIINKEVNKSISDGSGIPSDGDGIVDKYLSRDDYKTRIERDLSRPR